MNRREIEVVLRVKRGHDFGKNRRDERRQQCKRETGGEAFSG